MFTAAFGWNGLCMSIKSKCSNVLFKASVPLLIFYLNDVSINVCGILKYTNMVVCCQLLFLCLLVLAFCIQVLLCCGCICLSLHLMVTLWLLGPGVSCSKAWGLDLASACWRVDCGPELPGLVLVRE